MQHDCISLSNCRYSFEGVLQAIYGYDREPFECKKDSKRECIFQEGDDVLKELDVEHANFYIDFVALCSFFVVLRAACYLVLRWRVKMHWSTPRSADSCLSQLNLLLTSHQICPMSAVGVVKNRPFCFHHKHCTWWLYLGLILFTPSIFMLLS